MIPRPTSFLSITPKMTVSTTFGSPNGHSDPLLSFDDLGKLRILPAQVFEEAEKTRDESQDFVRGMLHSAKRQWARPFVSPKIIF